MLAYLLRGYTPITSSSIIHSPGNIRRYSDSSHPSSKSDSLCPEASKMLEQFNAEQQQAKEALLLGQYFQRRAYDKGRLSTEFEEGELVLINPHSLPLLRSKTSQEKKLLMRYNKPFEIVKNVSHVSYRLRMPAFYGIHPVLNIMHLEKYNASPLEFSTLPQKSLNREDFNTLPEYEVEKIVAECWKKG